MADTTNTHTETSEVNYAHDESVDVKSHQPDKLEPMYYKLEEMPSREALSKIEQLTNHFDASSKMTEVGVMSNSASCSLTIKRCSELQIMIGFSYPD